MSKLYRNARARKALRNFSRTEAGRLVRSGARFFHGPGGARRTRNLNARLRANRNALRDLERSAVSVTKYGFEAAEAINDLFRALGPVGQILKGVFKSKRGRAKPQDMIQAARDLLESVEHTVIAPGERQEEPPIEPQLSGRSILEPPRPGERTGLSAEHLTPASSNVYSFRYHFDSSTLYVRFKAPVLHSHSVQNTKGGGMRAKGGPVHVSGAQRPNQPGPLYAYLDVPVRVFRRMIHAGSAGKAVWDELRVRGTIYGHKYRYQLLQGALVPGEKGNLATYVPRRATPKGFRNRAVATVGTGKRGYIRSTLPERLVNRGEPNRGTPRRGR